MGTKVFSKTGYICLFSFLTAAVIFTAVIIGGGTYPFGDNCILRTDMYHQYAPFMAEYGSRLRSGSTLGFTWNLGLGVNFAAVMAYYLASPLNLILYFVGQDYTIEFMTVMIILKVGLAGAACALYFCSHISRNSHSSAGFSAYLFSLFYALSGYICAYYWNLMWLDSIACFPVVMLGAEKLMEFSHGILSGLLYAASLGYSIFTNYYISIFICIFLVIYFFAWNILHMPGSAVAFFRISLSFALWSLLAAGLAAFMLLPEISAFRYTISSETVFPTVFNDYFSFIRELSRHLPLVETEQGLDHWPNIYCGTGMLMMFFLYLSNRRISLREKVVYISMEIIFLMSFAINVLNFIWHGMHYPNSLPARQSFIYIFLMLVMGWRAAENIGCVTRRELGRSLLLSFAAILIFQEIMRGDEAYGFFVFYIAMAFTALYAVLLHALRKNILSPRIGCFLLALAAVIELSANTAYTSVTITSRKSFTADNDDVRLLVEAARDDAARINAGADADPGQEETDVLDGSGTAGVLQGTDAEKNGDYTPFIRIERSSRKSKNDGAWLSFPSASIFSSMANADCSELYASLGCESSVNAYSITGSTPLVDMLFGINYELTGSSGGENDFNEFVSSSGNVFLYRNKYALSLGFMMPDGMQAGWERSLDSPALVQNSLCEVFGIAEVLVPVYSESDASDGEFSVTIGEDGLYYAYESVTSAGDVTVRWSDRRKTFNNLDRKYFMELGELKKGEILSFKAEKEKDPEITIYKVNGSALEALYERLSAGELVITGYDDGYISGTVTVDTEGLGVISDRARMLVTTPYDEGWSVLVDGEPAETSKGLGAFLSFYLSGGTHYIEMSYDPPGRSLGAAVSLMSLAVLIMAVIIAVREKRWYYVTVQSRRNDEKIKAPDEGAADGEDSGLLEDIEEL